MEISARTAPAPLLLRSALLGRGRLVAGFSTRRGGDDLQALAGELGLEPSRIFTVSQVHGARVLRLGADDSPERVRRLEADALVTDEVGFGLAVRTADCVPVLVADPAGGAVAAAHAGWRGLVAGVIDAAVAAVAELSGRRPAALLAAVGPAIGPCCFEVGEEVADAIAEAAGSRSVVARRAGGPRPFVDLPRAAILRLARAGLAPASVESLGTCTRCNPELLHSFRRDGPGAGRQLGLVAIRASGHPRAGGASGGRS